VPKQFQKILDQFFAAYSEGLPQDVEKLISELRSRESISVEDFRFYLTTSSVFSSKIEGNTLDLNSFMRMRNQKEHAAKKEIREIEDLISAYEFAGDNALTLQNFLSAHALLSKTLVESFEQGKFRKSPVGVYDSASGKPVYLAVEPHFIESEIQKLFDDIQLITSEELSPRHVLYYASMLHLWIAMIHPFADGNGRAARLAEKWFLASAIGRSAWSINSEKFYWDNRADYYQNIALGYNYYSLDWKRCIPFLQMLPNAIREYSKQAD